MKPFIVIDRQDFSLTLFNANRWSVPYRFKVAVGKPGAETPRGIFTVLSKSTEPDWRIPENPDYAVETWGTTIPFGAPGNPFAVGFINLGNGVGIHATTFPPRIGTSASHGCVRMRKNDMRRIYDRVPVGAQVVIF